MKNIIFLHIEKLENVYIASELQLIQANAKAADEKLATVEVTIATSVAEVDKYAARLDVVEKDIQTNAVMVDEQVQQQIKAACASVKAALDSAEKKNHAHVALMKSAEKKVKDYCLNSAVKVQQQLKNEVDHLHDQLCKKLVFAADEAVAKGLKTAEIKAKAEAKAEAEARAKEDATFLKSISDWMWHTSKQ